MAVSVANLDQNTNTTNTTTYNTASVSPASDSLLLLAFMIGDATSVLDQATVSGLSLSWSKIAQVGFQLIATSQKRLFVYGALTGASPGSGAITVNGFSPATVNGFTWSVDVATGVDVSGGTVASVALQSDTEASDSNVGSLTSTLSSFASSTNGTYGALGIFDTATAITAGSGFTKLADQTQVTPACEMATEWKATADTTVDFSWTTNRPCGMVSLELKEQVAAAPTRKLRVVTNPQRW